MKRTRALAWVLAVVLVVGICPVASAAGTSTYQGKSYSTDYTTWRQADPAWGPTALGDVHTMSGSGCLITSIAILMCHSGVYDPAYLNPGTLRDWLDSQGYISHSSDRSQDALLSFGLITRYTSPRFYFTNQTFFSTSTPFAEVMAQVEELLADGYSVIARVNYSGHFVPIARSLGGDAQLYDPGANAKKLLSEYDGTIGGLLCFRSNPSGKDTILPETPTPNPEPGTPSVNQLSADYGVGDAVTVSWGAASLATHYNIYVDRKNADGTWESNYQVQFYATSPCTLKRFPAGTYRLRVQAANANTSPWTYANSAWQTFTVHEDMLTITYNANGGTVSPGSQLVSADSTYDLPTPTRSNAAFLGWHTNQGKEMVTNGTAMKSTYGHTLVAYWDTAGHSFTKSGSYQNTFRDVSSSAWYYSNVAAVYEYGLMDGVEGNIFKPNDQVSAAQAVTLAARLRKLYLTGNGTFSASSPWYQTYLDYALSQGILDRAPADMNAKLTRQEFAAILANALPEGALLEINNIPTGSIPDVYRSDTGIYELYRAGVLSGNDAQGTFRPNSPITRAEAATILVRMADPNSRLQFELA